MGIRSKWITILRGNGKDDNFSIKKMFGLLEKMEHGIIGPVHEPAI